MSPQRARSIFIVIVVSIIGVWGLFSVSTSKMAILAANATEVEFLTFHHSPMGLTLSYPADWKLETHDMLPLPPTPEHLPEGFQRDVITEGDMTFSNHIDMYAPSYQENPSDQFQIFINFRRISEKDDLLSIIELENVASRSEWPIKESPVISITKQTQAGIDDKYVVSIAGQFGNGETIWIAKDGLIFGIGTGSKNPEVITMMHKIVATFQFDGTTPQLFEKYKEYTTDGDSLRWSIEMSTPKPGPECSIVCRDAQAAALTFGVSMPTSETVAEEIPQQVISPLEPVKSTEPSSNKHEILTYRGATNYVGTREYEMDYDPTRWQLIEVPENTPRSTYEIQRLQNREDTNCMIDLYGGPIGVEITERIELAGRKWILAEFLALIDQTKDLRVPIIMYITNATDPVAGEIGYFLAILLPTQEDSQAKQQCRQQAEEVIATFRIVDSVRKN